MWLIGMTPYNGTTFLTGIHTHPLCSLVPVKHANKNPACLLIEVAPVVVDKGLTQLYSIDKARPVLVYSLQSQQTGRWND